MTKLRKLGADGPEVFPVGYGAMSFADFYGEATEAGSHAILDLAMDAGLTHLDTSNVYGAGRSETWIGSYLAKNPSAKDFFTIATKAGIAQHAEKGGTTSIRRNIWRLSWTKASRGWGSTASICSISTGAIPRCRLKRRPRRWRGW